MAFLTGWRLALAADLLEEPEATVGAVAREVGYGSAFALSTAFKRERGVSPASTAWRHLRRRDPHLPRIRTATRPLDGRGLSRQISRSSGCSTRRSPIGKSSVLWVSRTAPWARAVPATNASGV